MRNEMPSTVACYDVFELVLSGPATGNPFVDVTLSAEFRQRNRTLEVEGFYDGDGEFCIRFMPDEIGEWRYTTRSNVAALDTRSGSFVCTAPRQGAHGPVRVAGTHHFAYADGTRHFSIGTTCYAWAHQPSELVTQTLATLRQAPFNKLRMCVFPKHYAYNSNEPPLYVFERTAGGAWDFTRFNPAFFRYFEQLVGALASLNIEADIILFHPYDRWGFADMGPENDDRYVRYVVARLAAYPNVWWSLANEFNLFTNKSDADWDRFFRILETYDPYQHLRSVHNFIYLDRHDTRLFYDHGKPWVTHCSIQHAHVDLAGDWRELYHKPVVLDEVCYEGNLPNGWGNITAQEMVRRFWEGIVRGAYVGHGETYLDPEDVVWWSKGGVLKGESPARIAFLRRILEELPEGWLDPGGEITNTHLGSAASRGPGPRHYLTYFGVRQPAVVTVTMPTAGDYSLEVIDTWEMTITALAGTFSRTVTVDLPGKPYMALRVVAR